MLGFKGIQFNLERGSQSTFFYLCPFLNISNIGSHGIEPTWDWNIFLKILFVVARGGFYSYYNLQCIKLDKERKNVRKEISFMHTKIFLRNFEKWVQSRVVFNSTPTLILAPLYNLLIFFSQILDTSWLSSWFR